MEDNIQRDTYPNPFGGDDDIRVYTSGKKHMPSVTTVLSTRDADKSNLYDWQDRNDGSGDNAFHEYLFWYSRHIGTLGHWHALKTLDDSLEWTEDEAESAWALNNIDTIQTNETYTAYSERLGREFTVDGEDHIEVQQASPRDVLYSILKQQHSVETWGEFFDIHSPYESHAYYGGELLQQAASDIAFFRSGQQRLWNKLGVDEESVIAVEQFLFNEDHRYAGQVDLVYEDPRGYTVVADLKSSSGCYDKHQIQGAAYGKAIELSDDVDVETVDRLEVHRAHPRSGQLVAHTHDGADGITDLHETKYWDEGLEPLWDQFKQLTNNFREIDFDSLTQET